MLLTRGREAIGIEWQGLEAVLFWSHQTNQVSTEIGGPEDRAVLLTRADQEWSQLRRIVVG